MFDKDWYTTRIPKKRDEKGPLSKEFTSNKGV